ncbi:CinA family protein [Agromyces laixinhei]|uniref:CinA family protein n=1 Tax=Agromyces laixinhei TaxID=2585717 RepID=UPI0012EEA6E0|nr:CinA family protein [Agromyces laixinhei]
MTTRHGQCEILAEEIGALARASALGVGVAESLTGGAISSSLASSENASKWFVGGIVAYRPRVKFEVLGVTRGPVVTHECAMQMAEGARVLLGADVAVAATGAGGPDSVEGHAPGTVFIAVAAADGTAVKRFSLGGSPSRVVEATVETALQQVADTLRRLAKSPESDRQ